MTALLKPSVFLQEAHKLTITDKNSLDYADLLIDRARVTEKIIKDQLQEGLEILKAKIIAFQDAEREKRLFAFQNNNVSEELMLAVPIIESKTVTRRKKTDWEIVDLNKIKDEYKVIAIDKQKINYTIAQLEAANLDPKLAETIVGGIRIVKTTTPAFKPRAKE